MRTSSLARRRKSVGTQGGQKWGVRGGAHIREPPAAQREAGFLPFSEPREAEAWIQPVTPESRTGALPSGFQGVDTTPGCSKLHDVEGP